MMPAGLSGLENQLLLWLMALIRPGAALLAAPVFGSPMIPVQLRLAVALAIGAPAIGSSGFVLPPEGVVSPAGALLVAGEIVLGVAIGFVVQIAFSAAMVAGEALSNAMGLGFASMVDPMGGTSSPAVGQFLSFLATFLFLAMGGHLILAATIAASFESLPPGQIVFDRDMAWSIVATGSLAFAGGVAVALPVGLALLLVQIVTAMIARSTPTLNLFAVGVPATLLAGVILLAIATPIMADGITAILVEGLERARALAGAA